MLQSRKQDRTDTATNRVLTTKKMEVAEEKIYNQVIDESKYVVSQVAHEGAIFTVKSCSRKKNRIINSQFF